MTNPSKGKQGQRITTIDAFRYYNAPRIEKCVEENPCYYIADTGVSHLLHIYE